MSYKETKDIYDGGTTCGPGNTDRRQEVANRGDTNALKDSKQFRLVGVEDC